MAKHRSHKCCVCGKNKGHLKGHLKRRHNLFWEFIVEKLPNQDDSDDATLQECYADYKEKVSDVVKNVIGDMRNAEARRIAENDEIFEKFIESQLEISALFGEDEPRKRQYIRSDIKLTTRLMEIMQRKLNKILTMSTLMIPANVQMIKESLMQLAERSNSYPRKLIQVLKKCAALVGTESEFSITCEELVELQRAGHFPEVRRQSSTSNAGSDHEEEAGSPPKRRRVIVNYREEESDDGELGNNNSIEKSCDEDAVQPQLDDDGQVSKIAKNLVTNCNVILSRVDEEQVNNYFMRAKQRFEATEPEIHNLISESSSSESDERTSETVNDSQEGQSSLSSFSLHEDSVEILEDENNCQEMDNLDSLLIRLNKIRRQLENIESVSLSENRLQEQQREQRCLQSELESVRRSVEALTALSINSNYSKTRIKEIQTAYSILTADAIQREKILKEIYSFHKSLKGVKQFEPQPTPTDSQDPSELDFKERKVELVQLMNELGEYRSHLEMAIKKGKNLIDKENVTDAAPIKDKIETLETELKNLFDYLEEEPSKPTCEQFTAYDVLLEEDHVLDWLSNVETRVSNLEPGDADDPEKLKIKNEIFKAIQKEYLEYKEKIDSIRDFVMIHDSLLKEHGSTEEQDNLDGFRLEESAPREQFSEISQRYEQLGVELSHRQSELMVDDSKLKEVLDGYNSLNSWLGTMERVASAFGVIPMDPTMIDSQSKQVKVLQEEFRMKKPEFDGWIAFGEIMLSTDDVKIDVKVNEIRQRFQQQIEHLERRAQDLNDALNTRSGFYANVNYHRETLEKIAVEFNQLPSDGHPEGQLSKLEDLKRRLEYQKSLFDETSSIQLHEDLSGVRTSMQCKLTGIEDHLSGLQEKCQREKAKIEECLRDRKQFEASCKEILGWLACELENIPEKLLISADQRIIQQQLDRYERIHETIVGKETKFMDLMDKGKDIMMKSCNAENKAIKEDLDKVQSSLDRLKKETLKRRVKLETCAKHCQNYHKAFSSLSSSIQETEVQLQNLMTPKSLTASVDDTGVDEHIKILNSFTSDVLKRSKCFKNLQTLGEDFLSACDINTDVVKNELKDMETRWRTLFSEINDYTTFSQHLSNIKTKLLPYENRCSFYDNFGDSSKDGIKKLREETKTLQKELQVVKELRNKLVRLPEAIDLQVIDVSHRIEDLGEKLDKLISA